MTGMSRNISHYEEHCVTTKYPKRLLLTPSAYTRGLQFTKKDANLVGENFAYSCCAIPVDNIYFFSFFKDKFSRETFTFYATQKTSVHHKDQYFFNLLIQ